MKVFLIVVLVLGFAVAGYADEYTVNINAKAEKGLDLCRNGANKTATLRDILNSFLIKHYEDNIATSFKVRDKQFVELTDQQKQAVIDILEGR